MKHLSIIIFILTVSIFSCKNNKQEETAPVVSDSITPPADAKTVENQENKNDNISLPEKKNPMMEGTIMMKGDVWVIRGTNELSEMKDYFPSNLSAEFRVEGMHVEFSGVISEIPSNVRMAGVPITLTEIDNIK